MAIIFWLPLLLLSLAVVDATQGCSAGKGGPACTPCEMGKYSGAGARVCKHCPVGRWSAESGTGPESCYLPPPPVTDFLPLLLANNFTVLNANPPIFSKQGFLTPAECRKAITDSAQSQTFEKGQTGTLDDPRMDLQVRSCGTSSTFSSTFMKLRAMMADLLKTDESFFELQSVRYGKGQKFTPHLDSDHGKNDRRFTFFLYLNTLRASAGGATHFVIPDLRISPKAGTLVAWANFKDSGELDLETEHEGEPVLQDVSKLAINIWVHVKPGEHSWDGMYKFAQSY